MGIEVTANSINEETNSTDFLNKVSWVMSFFSDKIKWVLWFWEKLTIKEKYEIYNQMTEELRNGWNLRIIKQEIKNKYWKKFFDDLPYTLVRKLESSAIEWSINIMTKEKLTWTSIVGLMSLLSSQSLFINSHVINSKHEKDLIREYKSKARIYVTLCLKEWNFDFDNENFDFLRRLYSFCNIFDLNTSKDIKRNLQKPLQKMVKAYIKERKWKDSMDVIEDKIIEYIWVFWYTWIRTKK